jgi:hypothetical protein
MGSNIINIVNAASHDVQYRSRLYEEIQLGAAAALRKLSEATTELDEWKKRDAAHCEELRDCLQATRTMKERYSTEIDHLHRMNEEALVAVRVAEYESGTEVNRLKDEYRTRFQQETRDVHERVQELQEGVSEMSRKYKQTAACLEKVVRHSAEQQERLSNLTAAYHTLKELYRSAARVVGGVDSLTLCCRPRVSGGGSAALSRHAKQESLTFEPFLDPLEEVPVRRRVTFRVAAYHVLAAVRLRYLLRAAKHRRTIQHGSSSRGGDNTEVNFPLPPLYELQDKTPAQVASLLRQALREHDREGVRESNAPRFRVHQDMPIDEFDTYLRHYSDHDASTSVRSNGTERSLLQRLSYGDSPARTHLRGIYQMRNVGVLYKTLSDMSSAAESYRTELEQVKVR